MSNPLGKFLVIKGVVFWCFFQHIILQIVLLIGYIPRTEQFTTYALVGAVEQVKFRRPTLQICISIRTQYEYASIRSWWRRGQHRTALAAFDGGNRMHPMFRIQYLDGVGAPRPR